jgi:hypothetical protein
MMLLSNITLGQLTQTNKRLIWITDASSTTNFSECTQQEILHVLKRMSLCKKLNCPQVLI